MSKSILIAYASRYGSTQEVAEAVAATLRDGGLQATAQAMSQVSALAGYDAFVLGAALYSMKWHPEAHQFLSQHEATLRQRPVAIFSLGPITTDAAAMKRSQGQLAKELTKYPWLKPVALEMFVGRIDPAKMGFLGRLLYGNGDKRDWTAIRAWANTLPTLL